MLEERRSGLERRKLESQIKELRYIIFNMLNFTNMYVLVLDEQMVIKFANNSLAIDLGVGSYKQILGRCWLDFIQIKDHEKISVIHKSIANGSKNWEEKYKEVKGTVLGKDGKNIHVCWFNSHINSDYNWTFSFGIRKKPIELSEDEDITIHAVRNYYHDIINKDRVMINSIREMIGLENKIIDSCKPSFAVEFKNEDSIYV